MMRAMCFFYLKEPLRAISLGAKRTHEKPPGEIGILRSRWKRILLWGTALVATQMGNFSLGPVAAVEPTGLRDVKPPVSMPSEFSIIHILLLALMVLGIGGGLFWFFRRRGMTKVKELPVPRLSPWELAIKRLEELRAENLPSAGNVKEYYSQLSDIIRHYLEDRFSIKAPDMTTEEFLSHLRNSSVLNGKQKESLKNFLTCCDMAKFARYLSSPQQMDESWEFAERLVSETRPEVSVLIPGTFPKDIYEIKPQETKS